MPIQTVKCLNLEGRNVLINEADIATRIQQMGKEIQVYLAKYPMKTIFVGVLTGGADFTMKLIAELDPNTYMYNFVKVTRYATSQKGGEAQIVFDGVTDEDVKDARIIILDDVADERITNACLVAHYKDRGALEVSVCVLLNKYDRKSSVANVALDWVGFDIPNVFVWGFGLDDSSNSMTRNDHDVCYWGEAIPENGFKYMLPSPQTMKG